jgi:hypothetical protein
MELEGEELRNFFEEVLPDRFRQVAEITLES